MAELLIKYLRLGFGFFLIQAAHQSNSNQVRGLEGALDSLARQPYGLWLLGIVAIGLIAYGVYY
ncbi:MAG: DUF1206 domain-containing protein, partial [Coleofasciculus sp. Co-bin14]|nr:DUF1206 domain-containing protein [Coleofasciculus sp. Co-bin14]